MRLVYADQDGNVYDDPDYTALGRNGDVVMELLEEELIPLPEGSTLVSLPGTRPLGMRSDGRMERIDEDDRLAVGALLPQGFTRLMLPGYVKRSGAEPFPLFGYTAVVWKDGAFHAAARLTDDPEKWNPANCDVDALEEGVRRLTAAYPDNRLYQHLSHCALGYECLTASNTFLQRWEGVSAGKCSRSDAASGARPLTASTCSNPK